MANTSTVSSTQQHATSTIAQTYTHTQTDQHRERMYRSVCIYTFVQPCTDVHRHAQTCIMHNMHTCTHHAQHIHAYIHATLCFEPARAATVESQSFIECSQLCDLVLRLLCACHHWLQADQNFTSLCWLVEKSREFKTDITQRAHYTLMSEVLLACAALSNHKTCQRR